MPFCLACNSTGHTTRHHDVPGWVSVCPQDAAGYPVEEAAAVRWEAAGWPRDGDPAEPEWVELFDTEAEARAAVEVYAGLNAPGPTSG